MKSLAGILFCLCITFCTAQQRFIRTNMRTDFGGTLRILPSSDNGWVILSLDSMKISKFNSCGQYVWSKKYNIPNEITALSDFISSKFGGYILLNRIKIGQLNSCLVTRLDDTGNILWSKSYDDTFFDQYGYTLNEDAFGNIFIHLNHSHTNGPYANTICKLNSNGNILWVKHYDFMQATWGGGTITSDNGMIVRYGNVIGKIDFNGNVEWTYSYSSPNTYHYYAPIEVSDGYIFTKSTNASSKFIFYKIDRHGIPVPGGAIQSDFGGTRPVWKTKANGNIAGLFNYSSNGINHPMIVEFDTDMNILFKSSIAIDFFATDFCFNSSSEAIIVGTSGSKIVFARLDDMYRSSCDTLSNNVNMTTDNFIATPATSSVVDYPLIATSHNIQIEVFADSVNTICTMPLSLDLGRDTLLCNVSSMILRNNQLGLFDEYQWSTGATTPYIRIEEPGMYWLIARNHCEDSVVIDSIYIDEDEQLTDFLGTDRLECKGNSIVLNAPQCNCTYSWHDGSTEDSILVTGNESVILNVTKNNGCVYSDIVNIEFSSCDCFFYLPNAFTPNDDGNNETFRPVYECDISNYEISIFNRWSEKVYHSTEIEKGWSGYFGNVKSEQGVYYYLLEYTPLLLGKKLSPIKRRGSVTIIY